MTLRVNTNRKKTSYLGNNNNSNHIAYHAVCQIDVTGNKMYNLPKFILMFYRLKPDGDAVEMFRYKPSGGASVGPRNLNYVAGRKLEHISTRIVTRR